MEKIKMVDLLPQYLRIKPEIDQAILDVLTSTAFIQGPQVSEFANMLAAFTGTKHVIPCANGTDALQISMMALGFKPGDEVILPVHTYVATAEVIALLGLTPVFIDVDEKTFNLDVSQVKSKITKKTVGIVPVHLYGQCADMEPILKIAKEHNLHIIEDAAQSLGAEYRFPSGLKKKAGTMSIVGCTSFFPTKNLGCYGDGGAVFTDDSSLAETIKMMANHGQKIKYQHDLIGVNSRLDTLQASILKVKLRYLNEYEAKRIAVAAFYDKELGNLEGLRIPFRAPYSSHVYHQYTLKIEHGKRADFKAYLEKQGIPSMIYYSIPLHLQKAYSRDGIGEGSFPVTEKLSSSVISLPIHTEMNDEQLNYICSAIGNYFNG